MKTFNLPKTKLQTFGEELDTCTFCGDHVPPRKGVIVADGIDDPHAEAYHTKCYFQSLKASSKAL